MYSKNHFPIILLLIVLIISGCSKDIDPLDEKLNQANEEIKSGKVVTGKTIIDQVIKSDPQRRMSYISAMSIMSKNKLYKDSAELGMILINKNKQGEIDKELTKEEIARLKIEIGIQYQEAGDLDSAENVFISAFELSPNSPELMNALGWFYADNDIKLDKALELTKKAADMMPKSGHIADSLGWTYYKLGEYDKALETMKKAVELNPDHSELRYHLGAIYIALNKNTHAKIELEKALFLDNNLIEAREMLDEIKKNPNK